MTFRQEALGYREVLPFVSVHRPRCYFAGVDADNGQGVVVLDDIVSQGGTINRALEAPSPDEAADFLDALALLHASSWDVPLLSRLSWLSVCMADDDTFREFLDGCRDRGLLVQSRPRRGGRSKAAEPQPVNRHVSLAGADR